MSLKNAGKNVFGKKMGHWKPFADIWSWMKKARRRSENICMMSKCS